MDSDLSACCTLTDLPSCPLRCLPESMRGRRRRHSQARQICIASAHADRSGRNSYSDGCCSSRSCSLHLRFSCRCCVSVRDLRHGPCHPLVRRVQPAALRTMQQRVAQACETRWTHAQADGHSAQDFFTAECARRTRYTFSGESQPWPPACAYACREPARGAEQGAALRSRIGRGGSLRSCFSVRAV